MGNLPGIHECAMCGRPIEIDRDGIRRDWPRALGTEVGVVHTHGERLRLVKGGTPAAS